MTAGWDAARGFTLMELMVVVALIGILIASIIPEMKGSYQDALLRSTSRDLINVFDVTYSRAVSLNQIRRVCLDEKDGKYLVQKQIMQGGQEMFVPVDDAGSAGELNSKITMTYHTESEMAVMESTNAADGATPGDEPPMVTGGPEPTDGGFPSIAFYPDGTADPAVVELTDRDGFRLALRINPITARVHVEELARK